MAVKLVLWIASAINSKAGHSIKFFSWELIKNIVLEHFDILKVINFVLVEILHHTLKVH
jgi:hypothetical protein